MTSSRCRIDQSKDMLLVSHGLSGHRINWLRIFLEKAVLHDRVIHLLVERENSQEDLLGTIYSQFTDNLCIHMSGKHGVDIYTEVVKIRSKYPKIVVSTSEAEEWYKLILRLRHNIRVLFMRPYLQELTFSGVRNYLIKFLVASFLMMMKHSKVGFLAIPGDRPRFYRKNWVDELGSKRSISEEQAWRTLSSIEDEIALSENDGIVLVPGFISKRKNPELILEAFDIFSKNHEQKKYALVFAGKIDQECKEIFRRPKYQFAHFLDRYLTENEYSALLKSSKLVVLVYDNRASSGVIVDCIEVSTKVILSGADRWKNLFQIYPESIFRGRKSSISLAEQFAQVLLKPKVNSQSFIWRENRADVLQFFLD